MIDPVCGMEVNPELCKIRETYQGQEFYFCDESCRKAFWMNPERYLPWKPGKKPDRRKNASP